MVCEIKKKIVGIGLIESSSRKLGATQGITNRQTGLQPTNAIIKSCSRDASKNADILINLAVNGAISNHFIIRKRIFIYYKNS